MTSEQRQLIEKERGKSQPAEPNREIEKGEVKGGE